MEGRVPLGCRGVAGGGGRDLAENAVDVDQVSSRRFFVAKNSPGRVIRIDLSNGGAPEVTELGSITLNIMRRMAGTNAAVYVLEEDGKAKLWRMTPGGTFLAVADKLAPSNALAIDAQYVYFTDGSKVLRTSR